MGPLPITGRGRNYILTAVDYLSRWAEAKAVRQITAKDVAKFVYEEICNKFGVPLELLLDQGPGFRAELLDFLCEKMKITRRFTNPYYPQCNGLNERFNGELVQILSKVREHQGKNWDLELPSVLWAYRTAVKTGIGFTPFHLVYGKEALLPVEVEIPAIKMLEKVLGQSGDAFKQQLLHLQEVQLNRLNALQHYEKMQDKALGKISKKIKDKGIEKGDLVLRYNSKLDKTFQKKFQVKWKGLFKVVPPIVLADLSAPLSLRRIGKEVKRPPPDGSAFRPSAASGGIALYDPEGKLVCKKGFKLDSHSNNEAEYATLEAGLHICLKHGVKRLCIRGDALLVVKQVLGVWKTKNSSLREICFKIKSLLKWFEAWSIRHIERAMNEEAHDAAQGMIGEIFMLKADRPLNYGREILEREEEFLLTGVVPKDIEKPKKYGFLRRDYKYKLIGDVLYMLGADLVLRRVPWKEELYKVLEENHEGACGGHFALKISLHKILQEGYVLPKC
ncbi:hypothetical protein L7F22_051238 [Adiantum nelumboides]|nr:hypothetical protein [Adiantum nelumboides]